MKTKGIYKGDLFYLQNEHGRVLRKISWVGENNFEWAHGWCPIEHLELNPNTKSKVKFIINQI